MRILITGAQGPAGLALARQLKGTNVEVIGVDMAEPKSGNRHLFAATETICRADDPSLVPELNELIEKYQIDLVIPTVQEELPILSATSKLFSAPVLISPVVGVELADDKLFTAWALRNAGIAVPQTDPLGGRFDTDLLAETPTPYVIKPRRSRGGRGVVVCDEPISPEEIDGTGQIIQEFAPGTEYAVQVYQPVPGDDGTPIIVVLEKTEMKEGRVGNAVRTKRLAQGEALDVESLALMAVEALGLHGPIDLDIRRTEKGAPVVLEINARFGANSEAAPEILNRILHCYRPKYHSLEVAS